MHQQQGSEQVVFINKDRKQTRPKMEILGRQRDTTKSRRGGGKKIDDLLRKLSTEKFKITEKMVKKRRPEEIQYFIYIRCEIVKNILQRQQAIIWGEYT